MASPAQIDANRRNALKSTGPRSAEGKGVSRWNALKTGIQAKLTVIPGEKPAELEQLTAEYHQQFQPASPVERFLVDSLVMAEWHLRRYRLIESVLWAVTTQGFTEHPAIARLHRRIDAAERSYHRALRELHRCKAQTELEAVSEDTPELASFSSIPAEPPRAARPGNASDYLTRPAAPLSADLCPATNLALRL